ncbi:MAG: hypothetical protein ABI646_02620, partial [Acidobacteriota bacterium]
MKNAKHLPLLLILLAVSLSCSFLKDKTSKPVSGAPTPDFITPGKSLDVKVQLDNKKTATGKITPAGGSLSLTSADGSTFKLEIPPNAIEKETEITMTAVKTIDGAPLDKNAPTAVQLEPSGLFFKEVVTLA